MPLDKVFKQLKVQGLLSLLESRPTTPNSLPRNHDVNQFRWLVTTLINASP